MRLGVNPVKNVEKQELGFRHQIIIPVFIPDQEEYFKDSLKIFKACLESLFSTISKEVFISIVDNGSCEEVKEYLTQLISKRKIDEVIFTENIGKVNAIYKGLIGNRFDLITIADADVKFLPGWQKETYKVFNEFPKAGTVGLIPQYNMFSNNCTNVIFDNFFNSRCKFYPVEQPEEMRRFYLSLGLNMPKDHYYLKSVLGIEGGLGTKVCIGAGHVVATYRSEIFQKLRQYIPQKMGWESLNNLDNAAQKSGKWRLTTFKNFAYHMGNVWEDWMEVAKDTDQNLNIPECFPKEVPFQKEAYFSWMVKNKIFKKLLRISYFNRRFLIYKKLPKEVLKDYPKVYY